MEREEVLFSPLQAYTKNAPTILAAYNKPTELHQGAPDPREVLPPTRHVHGACLENKETTTDWCSNTLVRAGGGAPDCCRQKTLHPLHKRARATPSGTGGGRATPGLGGLNGENRRKAQRAGQG